MVILTSNKGRVILIICGIFIVEKAKSFSEVSGAHVFKTKYGWFDCFHCC